MSSTAINELSGQIIGSAIEVHTELCPGLLESAYEVCLCKELSIREIPFRRQVPVPVEYKGTKLDAGYQIDLLVDERIVVELKSVETLTDVHKTQILTYMKLLDVELGLLMNFNVARLMDGLARLSIGAPNL